MSPLVRRAPSSPGYLVVGDDDAPLGAVARAAGRPGWVARGRVAAGDDRDLGVYRRRRDAVAAVAALLEREP